MMAMRIIIFDVEHGFCGFIRTPTGRSILVDCGCKNDFSPIQYIIDNMQKNNDENGKNFTNFALSHPHGDHIQDVENLIKYPPRIITMNTDYNWTEVDKVNSDAGKQDTEKFRELLSEYSTPSTSDIDYGIDISAHTLTYEGAKKLNPSKAVNNSSGILIVKYNKFKIVFPGDIETDGWEELLKDKEFQTEISKTNVFIASHHGHTSGYNRNIFKHMGKPDIVIVSAETGDEHVDTAYSKPENVKGILFDKDDKRYMLTTRSDGSIFIDVEATGDYKIRTYKLPNNIKK